MSFDHVLTPRLQLDAVTLDAVRLVYADRPVDADLLARVIAVA